MATVSTPTVGTAQRACRLDTALFEAGLATSRTHARRIVEEGRALINNRPAQRAATQVRPGDSLALTHVPDGGEWASRAAHKLLGALRCSPEVAEAIDGARVLDVGASTGGFTDVCVRQGAAHVIAADVGRGQLIPRLISDSRVTNLEGHDVRVLTREQVGPVGVVVTDVSFISLTHVLPVLGELTEPGAHVLVMVKPQFEVGKSALPKSGVVTDPGLWAGAIMQVARASAVARLRTAAVHPSEVPGQDGNREFFLHLVREDRGFEVSDGVYAMIKDAVERARAGVAAAPQRSTP